MSLGDLCDIKIGGTPRTDTRRFWSGPHPWATITDMNSRYITRTERTLSDAGVANSSVKLLLKGTVLLSFKLSIGKVAIAGRDLYTNEAIAGLVPKDGRVSPEYLYYLLPALNLRAYAQPTAKGETLNKTILQTIRVPVPSQALMRAINKRMSKREARMLCLREKIEDIEEEIHGFVRIQEREAQNLLKFAETAGPRCPRRRPE